MPTGKSIAAAMGARLLEFSEKMGWSKAELARRAGIYPQEVNGYIEGKYHPIKLLPPLLDDGLDPKWFIAGTPTAKQESEEANMLRILRRNGIKNSDDLKRLIGKGVKYDFLTNSARIGALATEIIANVEKRSNIEAGFNSHSERRPRANKGRVDEGSKLQHPKDNEGEGRNR